MDVAEARRLVVGPGWRPSIGLGPGSHWRKTDGEGCWHIRIDGDRAFVHRDRWDAEPRRFVEHAIEAAFALPSVVRAWWHR